MRIVGVGDNVLDRYIDQGLMYPGGNAVNNYQIGRASCRERV